MYYAFSLIPQIKAKVRREPVNYLFSCLFILFIFEKRLSRCLVRREALKQHCETRKIFIRSVVPSPLPPSSSKGGLWGRKLCDWAASASRRRRPTESRVPARCRSLPPAPGSRSRYFFDVRGAGRPVGSCRPRWLPPRRRPSSAMRLPPQLARPRRRGAERLPAAGRCGRKRRAARPQGPPSRNEWRRHGRGWRRPLAASCGRAERRVRYF